MSKKRLIITSTISIVLVAILLIGSTYSIFTTSEVDESTNVYTTGVLDVTYTLSEDNVILDNSVPIGNGDSCKITPYRITVTNNGNVPYMFDIILNDTTASDVIDYQYIGTQVGQLETKQLSETTNNIIKEDVVVPAGSSVDIDVRVWISDTVQNSELGKSFYAKLAIDGLAVYDDREEINNDNLIADSCYDPNEPNLDDGNLIPVYYNSTDEVWKKADSTNKNDSWYNYDNKMWANSILKDTNTIIDLSNNINNGTVNGASWNKDNKTITTDGFDDYIDMGLANHDFGSDLTFVIRVKFNDLHGLEIQDFFGNWEIAGGGFSINTDNNVLFSLHVNGSWANCYTSTLFVNTSEWYTLVGIYDGTAINIYMNGKHICNNSATGDVTVSTVPIYIGYNPEADGSIVKPSAITTSDVLIFDRALTVDEVVQDYADVPEPTDTTDLLLYYDFSDNNDIPVDTTISDSSDDGTLAFYTWIPRYKYRVWNITRQAGDESTYAYSAFTNGINIKWESGTNSTGNVECTYNTATVESETNLSDTCIYKGTDTITTTSGNTNYRDAWYTHPAFTFGDEEKTGFWIGKFEATGTAENPTVLPDVKALHGQNVSEQFTSSKKIQSYGLSNIVDAHKLTNLEWGAVAYLTHSKYGLCDSASCRDAYVNNSSSYYTGRSGGAISGSDELQLANVYPENSTETTLYNDTGYYTYKGYFIDYSGNITDTKDDTKLASTTGNITGVYDMSGGAYEQVMGNMVDSSNSFYPSSSGTNWNGSSTLDSKYYNAYSYSSSNYSGVLAFNRARLGDATAEVVSSNSSDKAAWIPGENIFGAASYFASDIYSWFIRGRHSDSPSGAGIFAFGRDEGNMNFYSFRSSIS